jgi:hypothetical protein
MSEAEAAPTYKRGKWAKIYDATTHKRYYFFNVESKQSQWTEPPDWASLAHLEIVVAPQTSARAGGVYTAATSANPTSPAVAAALAAAQARALKRSAAAVASSGAAGTGPKVRVNLSLDGTDASDARLTKKANKTAQKAALKAAGGKKNKNKAQNKQNDLYCPICDVTANNLGQMHEHRSGRKHKTAVDAFKETGTLAGSNSKARASAATARLLSAAQLDPTKKAERASRFNTEYVEKVVLGKEDDSHRRVVAWGGDNVTHNADEAIAKFLERKRKAALSDAREKGVAAEAELAKRAVDPKLLNLALNASSKHTRSSVKTTDSKECSGSSLSSSSLSSSSAAGDGAKRKVPIAAATAAAAAAAAAAPAAKKKIGKWSL